VVGRKFTIFALFHFVFEGKFPYIQRGDLTEGFLLYEFGELIFGGANTLRGLFSQFYGISGSSRNAPPQFKKKKNGKERWVTTLKTATN